MTKCDSKKRENIDHWDKKEMILKYFAEKQIV